MYTIDPKKVIVSIGGITMHGFADGEFISIERDRDTWEKVVGADAEVTRTKINDMSGTLALTLKQSSPSNDILSGFMLADELSNSGIVPVLIVDKSGRSVVFSAEAWIAKPPSQSWGNSMQDREWTLHLAKVDNFVGGN